MKVISFCVYGEKDKYCKGLYENLKLIKYNLSDYNVFIYVGDGVPNHWISIYKSYEFVRIIETGRIGHDNMINRFYAIDEPDVDIALIQDIDARVHERNIWCIRHFEKSDFMFHTARDHPYHDIEILGGSWGIKKGCIDIKILDLYNKYNSSKESIDKMQHDQYFLRDMLYPLVILKTIVYVFNECMKRNNVEKVLRIPFDVINDDFCGLAITYDNSGNPIKEYKWDENWNSPTIVLKVDLSYEPNIEFDRLKIINFCTQLKTQNNKKWNYHIYIDNNNINYEKIKNYIELELINTIVFSESTLTENSIKYKYNKINNFSDNISNLLIEVF